MGRCIGATIAWLIEYDEASNSLKFDHTPPAEQANKSTQTDLSFEISQIFYCI